MSTRQQRRTGQPDQTGPTGPLDFCGADELDAQLADPRDSGPLGRLLAAAAAPVEAKQPVGEEAALHAFRMAFAASPGRDGRFLARMSGRAAAATLVGGLVLGGGVAAAATGALPDPVQKATKGVLAKVGVHVPGPNKHANEHASQHGKSTAKPHGRKDAGTGNAVSDLARSTTATGVDKGALISGFASDGKSHAGQHGKAGTAAPSPKASSRHNGSTHQPKTSRHARTVPPKGTPPSPAHTGTGP